MEPNSPSPWMHARFSNSLPMNEMSSKCMSCGFQDQFIKERAPSPQPPCGHFLGGGQPPCPEDTQATLWREVSSKASSRWPALWVGDLQANLLPHSDPQGDASLPDLLISVLVLHHVSALASVGVCMGIVIQVWLLRRKSFPLLSAV